jgi:hypothetical protein
MTDPANLLRKRLPLIFLLTALAMLRAERGTAEVQGRTGAPSRLFHVAPAAGGWRLSLLGYDTRLPSSLPAVADHWRDRARDTLADMKKALP